MSFFSGFPQVNYKFGNEEYSVLFENISAYVDLIDRLKEDTSFYTTYTILEGDRPDVVSHNLYETSVYYWTFFFLNDHLRQEGWPLTNAALKTKIKKKYPNTTLVTRDDISSIKLFPQSIIKGEESGVEATVLSKNLNLGQVVVEGTKTFTEGEVINVVPPIFPDPIESENYTLPKFQYLEKDVGDVEDPANVTLFDNADQYLGLTYYTVSLVDIFGYTRDELIAQGKEVYLDNINYQARGKNENAYLKIFVNNSTMTEDFVITPLSLVNMGSTLVPATGWVAPRIKLEELTGDEITIMTRVPFVTEMEYNYVLSSDETKWEFSVFTIEMGFSTYKNEEVFPLSFTLESQSEQYNSAFYYTLNDEIVDIDPFVGPGALLNEVTYLDYFTNKNNENKNIKVLRPDVVTQVFSAYKKELTGL
jgi:hypothetical protein